MVNINDFFEFRSTTKTRGHANKLFKSRCTSSVHRNCFVASLLCIFRRTMCDVDFTDLLNAFSDACVLKVYLSVLWAVISVS